MLAEASGIGASCNPKRIADTFKSAAQVRIRGYLVDVGLVEVWERNDEGKSVRKNLEVDFVANKGSQRYYIQSAYALPTSEKVDQEERSLRNIGDSFKKIVIVNDDIMLKRNDAGVVTMSIRDFLLDEPSLER